MSGNISLISISVLTVKSCKSDPVICYGVCVYIESLVWHDWPFCLHLQGKINVGRIISVAWSAKLLDKLVHMQLIHALSCLHNRPGLFAYRQQRSACRRPNLACAYNNQPYLMEAAREVWVWKVDLCIYDLRNQHSSLNFAVRFALAHLLQTKHS